jgi:NifU-like protein involved in Fe-S cluster formation
MRRAPPLPVTGEWVATPQGLRARFSLDLHDGIIAEIRFESTPCATLVAYCQALTEHESGRALMSSPSVTADGLVALLEGVPPLRRDRAILAVAALRAAIVKSISTRESVPQ